jgi:two-component system, sensor histidine kinase YesM
MYARARERGGKLAIHLSTVSPFLESRHGQIGTVPLHDLVLYTVGVRYRFATLQSSFFFGFSGILGLILAVAFASFYAFFSVYCEETVSNSHMNLCSSLAGSVDAEIMKMNTVSMNVVYSNLISEKFRDYLESGRARSGPLGKWKSAGTVFDVIWAMIGPFQTVSQVNIYSPGGAVIGAGIYNMEDEVRLGDMPWYPRTMALGGSKYIGLPERIPALELRNAALKNHEFLRLCRLFSSDRFVTEGIVEVLQDADTFFAPIERVRRLNKDFEIYVLDGEGRQAYPFAPGASRDGAYYAALISSRALPPEKMSPLLGPSDAGRRYDAQRRYREPRVATFVRAEYSGWAVVVVEPKAKAYLPLRRFTAALALASAAMLTLGWLATYFMARRLAVPLKDLQLALAGMDATDLVDPDLGPPSIRRAPILEIDSLNNSFRAMYEKLKISTKELVETRSEEIKARMLALQSLMNPHFIYNNLAAISAMANEGLTAEIQTMCDDVSQILRYISSGGDTGVELREEVEQAEKYLKCMKVRYGDHLGYTINLPQEMRGIIVPKLIIQPLVENSIKHGFDVSPPWRLELRGSAAAGIWRIEVSDSGIGFDPEARSRLDAQIARWEGSGKLPPFGIEGMGLLNIVLRLRMLYGESYVFEIADAPGRGARVTIGGRIDGR